MTGSQVRRLISEYISEDGQKSGVLLWKDMSKLTWLGITHAATIVRQLEMLLNMQDPRQEPAEIVIRGFLEDVIFW